MVDVRKKEHVNATRTEKSAIAEHVYEKNEPHDIDWSSFKVIDRQGKEDERKETERSVSHLQTTTQNE